VRDVLPAGAFAARFGGDEFEIALPGVPLAEAAIVGEAMRRAIERDLHREIDGRNVLEDLTCSVGVAYFDPERDSRDYRELMQRADAAMYEAKRLGKNRVVAEDREAAHAGASAGTARGVEAGAPSARP
jgi:diguanylate cyclase (GGDEF)-like protein